MLSAMISVVYRSFPCLSCHLRVRSLPSTNTCEPFRRYSEAISPSRPKKAMLCHSVRSCCAPESLSFHVSLVAMRMFVTDIPLGMDLVSGSAPSVPIKITLFTPRAIQTPTHWIPDIVHAPAGLNISVSRCPRGEMGRRPAEESCLELFVDYAGNFALRGVGTDGPDTRILSERIPGPK